MADKVLTPKEFMDMERAKDTAQQIKQEVERVEEEPEQKTVAEQPKKTEIKMEDYIEMRCYVKYNLYYGQPRHLIIQALLESGWQRTEIDKAFAQVEKPRSYQMKSEAEGPAVIPRGNVTNQRQGMEIFMPQASDDEDIPVPPPPQTR